MVMFVRSTPRVLCRFPSLTRPPQIHNICDHDRKTCFRKLKAVYRYCARIDRRPPLPLPPPVPKPRNMVYPRAGSCVGCQKDSTLLGEQQRCERCNLSR